MSSIAKQFVDTIQVESANTKNRSFLEEFDRVVNEMARLGLGKRPGYSIPLRDTIGRSLFGKINKRLPACR